MDDSKTFELKVGVFILIGVAILFTIVFSIGDINLSKTGYRVKVLFNFASGIGPSAPVRLAGVGVGQVQGIQIIHDPKDDKTKAELTAWISDGTKIEEDAVVTINTLGLMGEKYLEILPGTAGSAAVKPNGILVGKDPVPMEKITENLATLSESIKTIVDKIKKGDGTIGKLLNDDAIYNNLEAFTADIKKHPWKLLNRPRNEE
ncbi:MAG: MlaD family protein [Candidatus Omnitrophica bacterium]|nr:MlaD family protein [Candidatus Omnitrophota bacterium]